MLPAFPQFKNLELSDKTDIEAITSKYPPYSDFNFVSMWSWDTKGEMRISELNKNLVVRFTDYLTGEPFYSFLGDSMVNETAEILLKFSEREGFGAELKFISEEVIKLLDNIKFKVTEDKDNFDYVFSTEQLSDFKGKKYKSKRHEVNKFLTMYPNAIFRSENSVSPILHEHIVDLLEKWTEKKDFKTEVSSLGFENEKIALRKMMQIEDKNLLIFTCFLNNNLIGFEVDEILHSKYAISHFSKADISYGGIYDFLNEKVALYLNTQNVKLWSWEQDLGFENLKKTKMSYCPVNFLKKYKVSIIIDK